MVHGFGEYFNDPKAKPFIDKMLDQKDAIHSALKYADKGMGQAALKRIGKALESLKPMAQKEHSELIMKMIEGANKPVADIKEFANEIAKEYSAMHKITGKVVKIKKVIHKTE